MNPHSISNRQLDKYMEQILDSCGTSNAIQFSRDSYITDADFLKAIRMLEASGEIECRYPMNGTAPYYIRILPNGRLHFYQKDQQRIGFWKGFFSGLFLGLVPVIAGIIIQALL